MSFFGWKLVVGTITTFLSSALSTGAGIGGGALFVPIFIILLSMDPKEAIPLSQTMVMGGSFGAWAMLYRQRHPKANRPLIDYDTALVMEPMTLFGTIVGVYLNLALPDWLILVGLILLLSFTSYKTIKKAIEARKKEQEEAAKEASGSLLASEKSPHAIQLSAGADDEEADFDQVDVILREESKTPKLNLIVLFTCWFILLVLFILARNPGGHFAPVEKCGWAYWLIMSASFPVLAIATVWIIKRLKKRFQYKVFHGYNFLDGDVKWSSNVTTAFALLSIIAGAFAGMLGVGGGLVKGPLMLEMGVLPRVATATASFMIMFTSSSAVIQFILEGSIEWAHGVWYGVLGFVASMLGQLIVAKVVSKYKKGSLVAFLLGGLTVVSCLTLAALQIKNFVDHTSKNDFQSPCHSN